MNRQQLVLGILASAGGKNLSPVQLQKAAFLVSVNAPVVISSGPGFDFVPYDYGPFDKDVYVEAEALRGIGLAQIQPSTNGRWNTYSATDMGVANGRQILEALPPNISDYIDNVVGWVRSQSFSNLVRSIYDAYPEMRANSVFQD